MKRVVLVAMMAAAAAFSVPAYAQTHPHRITVGFTTHGFAGLKASYEYAPTPETRIGCFWRGSALTIARGDFDTGEVGCSAVAEVHPVEPRFFSGRVETGYRYQSQCLGVIQALFSTATVHAGVAGSYGTLALETGWEETWLVSIRYSDFVRETFSGRYDGEEPAPSGTRVLFPAGQMKIGVASAIHRRGSSDNAVSEILLSGGYLWTPNPFVAGFDGMMFGFFPFYAEVGVALNR